ncbi:N-6 DNA methylase [Massilia orientalis]|uniref:N-6 DNA methylase n=1 Tax=Massilia orientalis TaxID=3050128 RepID=A0ACC7MLP1_9BURK|nr:N-6 DNA methylase [Massilia sp. YIM B02787]
MLDTDTKRRIDSCRDILVGKVPDPKSQVEQITIALIYKFMDDMDAQSEEFGGKRSFFVNGFEKYSWSKLLAPSMGGQDTLNLYSEAVGKMTENTHLPTLFRDIFKNAYLPYRDPETLKAFLKEIDGFSYDHSERLGDAFEYLLSVLGSQGDAGQFRTPRHIIDFIVRVINPQKHERILDPACGTAGFLISAWKYILDQNQEHKPGDKLTPDERNKLAVNIRGYDISPDMVRLSLVNLYLHGFIDPHVDEYDTLTSEDKWNEHADVILANPPFMSPKGGIKPHKRFSIQATRSEVLFVDYIHEHLSPNGRAGIIVPEGIIFQNGTAYKALRKLLVQNSLVAVVSLPAGVFQPYSGVKTSILILDKRLAKQTDKVLFVKVSNDGFALGAQRRPIGHDDLPQAEKALEVFFSDPTSFESCNLAQAIKRTTLSESGEWNLSGDRYKTTEFKHSHYPVVPVVDVCDINPKKSELADLPVTTSVSFVPMQDISENRISFHPRQERSLFEVRDGAYTYFRDGDILLAKVSPCFENGKAGLAHGLKNGIGFGSSEFYVLRVSERIIPEYLYYIVTSERFHSEATSQMTGTGGLQRVPRAVLESFKIPLPTIEEQREIVDEITGYQKIIDGARQVLENYQPHIAVKKQWPVKSLSSLCLAITDGDHQPPPKSNEGVPFITISNIDNGDIDFSKTFFVSEKYFEALGPTKRPRRGDILYTVTGSFGIPVLIQSEKKFCFQRHIGLIRPAESINEKYLYYILRSDYAYRQAEQAATGVAQKTVSLSSLRNFNIPIPSIEEQKRIVDELDAEQVLIGANKELITRFETKIKVAIDRVWEN